MAAFDETTPALYSFLYGEAKWGTLVNPPPVPKEDPPLETDARPLEGDPLFFQTQDGGDVQICQGLFLRSGGLRNAFYLSWFGANALDGGLPGDRRSWWGNALADTEAQAYRGQTQKFLNGEAATSANLVRLESVMADDAAWMLDEGIITELVTEATIVGPKRVQLTARPTVNGQEETFTFFENWRAKS